MAYKNFASGYLVKEGKVLLVHHKKFDKWTPPGGHMEEDETPDQTVTREWKEEVGLDIKVISAQENIFAGDDNATPIPMPFYMDLEREGFDVPHIGHFFYVGCDASIDEIKFQKEELFNAGWFSKEDLAGLKTFEQVRVVGAYAIDHYPQE